MTFVSGVLLLSLSLSFATNLQNESEKKKKKKPAARYQQTRRHSQQFAESRSVFPYSCRRVIMRNFSSKT